MMQLPGSFSGTHDNIYVIIETPKDSCIKYVFDPKTGLFKFKKMCTPGLVFPLNFGFIPGTLAEDGDPMDALVLCEQPAFPGTLFECRVLGVLEIEQGKNHKTIRNDRVIACPFDAIEYDHIHSADDLGKEWLEYLGKFFKFYHKQDGDKIKLLDVAKPESAIKKIKKCAAKEIA
jgi:inorganic pyrophosphatase